MLDMGFIPDIERICKLVPFTRQTLFFTATMPPEIQRITEQFLHNPVRVEVSRPATTAATTTQLLAQSGREPHDKRDTLRRLIRAARRHQERHRVLQPQARRRDAAPLAAAARLFDAGAARRHGPAGAHGGARTIPQGRSHAADRLRRRRPRPRHPRREPHLQFRCADPSPTTTCTASAAPAAPDGPAPPSPSWRLERRQGGCGDREADRADHPVHGQASAGRPRERSTRAQRSAARSPLHREQLAIIGGIRIDRPQWRESTTHDPVARRRRHARAKQRPHASRAPRAARKTIPTPRTCPPSCCAR